MKNIYSNVINDAMILSNSVTPSLRAVNNLGIVSFMVLVKFSDFRKFATSSLFSLSHHCMVSGKFFICVALCRYCVARVVKRENSSIIGGIIRYVTPPITSITVIKAISMLIALHLIFSLRSINSTRG